MSTKTPTVLDLKGLACPLPIAKTAMAMKQLAAGERVEAFTTDRGSLADFPAWCASTGNRIVEQDETGGVYRFLIEKMDKR
jgi:tRNA 2-thiouridine synthesizing protein A